ncbi:HAD-IA family hydrolase [Hyphomonas johnsonii]|uniref:phosphoglycolate phosphatase n=1 Tax=Hyphomonas johnsonii MHS-2 TaxID=1280950 RepID=A0A059FTI8_9PROT|nr:HAD-IA family hydrolase [Hyphomonas johnsonii]KCZ93922.1 HAD family hydrolase [Hyphomonas johnsonii MHS-2]
MLRLAIWDMDGTIVDSRDVIQTAMTRAFEVQGLTPPPYDATRRIVGLGLRESCQILAPDDLGPERVDALVEAYRDAFIARRTDPDFREPLYDGAIETLQMLRDTGWLIAMATGKSRRGIRAIFEMHPLESYFDTIWCADDGPGKPHPFMVEQAMGALGAEPHQSLMIGDAIHDIHMGRAAGVRTLGVSWGFGAASELSAAGADEVHHTYATLAGSLGQFGQA